MVSTQSRSSVSECGEGEEELRAEQALGLNWKAMKRESGNGLFCFAI